MSSAAPPQEWRRGSVRPAKRLYFINGHLPSATCLLDQEADKAASKGLGYSGVAELHPKGIRPWPVSGGPA